MSRKHFIAVAEIIHERVCSFADDANAGDEHADGAMCATVDFAQGMATLFAAENPRFKRDRFYRACGLPELADN